jgi:hypothetical protein
MNRVDLSHLFTDYNMNVVTTLKDIVLEYVMSQFSPEQFQAAQRSVVKRFQEGRPAGGWTRNLRGDRTAFYIVHEIEHHVQAAWELGSAHVGHGQSSSTLVASSSIFDPTKDATLVSWVDDHVLGKFDAVARSAAARFGSTHLATLMEESAHAERWWEAIIRGALFSIHMFNTGVNVAEVCIVKRRMLEWISKVDGSENEELQYAKDTIELECVVRIMKMWNPADLDEQSAAIHRLLLSKACLDDPENQYDLVSIRLALSG